MEANGFPIRALLLVALTINAYQTTERTPLCPQACHCLKRLNEASGVREDTTDCSDTLMPAVPQDIPNSTETLTLRGNGLTDIEEVFNLGLPRLRTLDISYNKLNRISQIYPSRRFPEEHFGLNYFYIDWNAIDYIGESEFRGLDGLKQLSISHNKIERIHRNAFMGLFNLTHLNLSGNRLKTIDVKWFVDLRELHVFNVSWNAIDSLKAGLFSSLINLHVLDLSNCGLREIAPDALLGLEFLHTLRVQRNKLDRVPTTAFQRFADLNLMDMSANRFTELGPNSFHSINLSTLILNGMEGLKMIDSFAFQKLFRLTTLEIGGNRNLAYIDPRSFVELPNLKRLGLNKNNIRSIPDQLIQSLPDNVSIDLQHNPLSCDCNIGWLTETVQNQRLNINDFDNIACIANETRWLVSAVTGDSKTGGCSPIIVPGPPTMIKQLATKSVTIRCLGSGNPKPDIRWNLPGGATCRSGSGCGPVRVDKHGALNILRLTSSLQGIYTCLASNRMGTTMASTNVTAEKFKTHTLILEVGSNFLKYTWTDLDWVNHFEMQYKYEVLLIQYVNRGQDWVILRTFYIKPYMKYSTFQGLQSQHPYGVCITIDGEHDTALMNCNNVTTTKEVYDDHYRMVRDYVLGVGLTTIFIAAAAVAGCLVLINRYNRRHERTMTFLCGTGRQSRLCSVDTDSPSETCPISYENRGASSEPVFNEEDLEEIRDSISLARSGSTDSRRAFTAHIDE